MNSSELTRLVLLLLDLKAMMSPPGDSPPVSNRWNGFLKRIDVNLAILGKELGDRHSGGERV